MSDYIMLLLLLTNLPKITYLDVTMLMFSIFLVNMLLLFTKKTKISCHVLTTNISFMVLKHDWLPG